MERATDDAPHLVHPSSLLLFILRNIKPAFVLVDEKRGILKNILPMTCHKNIGMFGRLLILDSCLK